jgi:3-deoxy-D-manno-octulosonic acid kinase
MKPAIRVCELALDSGAMRFDANSVPTAGSFLFDPLHPELAAAAVAHGGRQAAWFVSGDFGTAVLRHYKRGGLMARISTSHYVWTGAQTTRSYAEFDLLHFMHDAGLPVPRPLAAAYWRRGLTYRAAIMIERLHDVQTLAHVLDEGHQQSVAEALFSMHEAGVWHADLNAYNVLVDRGGKAWLIDFDKGRRHDVLSDELRYANLLRLRRSLVKVAGEKGWKWWEELDHAYSLLARSKGHI